MYLFFTERAQEVDSGNGKVVYSRVARVCKVQRITGNGRKPEYLHREAWIDSHFCSRHCNDTPHFSMRSAVSEIRIKQFWQDVELFFKHLDMHVNCQSIECYRTNGSKWN